MMEIITVSEAFLVKFKSTLNKSATKFDMYIKTGHANAKHEVQANAVVVKAIKWTTSFIIEA